MRKLLLLFVLALTAIGAKAATISGTGISGATTTPTINNQTVKVQTLNVSSPGALAAWVESVTGDKYNSNNPFQGLGGSDDFYELKITGQLNAADLAALNSATCAAFSRFPRIDMSEVTLASGVTSADVCSVNFGSASFQKNSETLEGEGAEYLRLPDGLTSADDVVQMSVMQGQGKNDNLKVVGATNSSAKTEYALHSFSSNHVIDFINDFFGGYNAVGSGDAPTKNVVRMSGVLGDNDLVTSAGNTFGTVLAWDFTGATFDPYTIESLTLGENYTDSDHPYARGGRGTDAPNDPFAEPGSWGTMTLENYETNALYFLKNYGGFTSIILPTGNNDIPPQTFKDKTSLTSISIPENYVLIGHESFQHTGIAEVVIGNKVRTIEAGAFINCSNLIDVKFQPGLEDQVYGPMVFSNCQNIKHVVLPEGIKTLGAYMFNVSKNIESVRLPESLENIGTCCFLDANGLSSITLPQGLKKIGMKAFSLTSIKDVYLTQTDPTKLPLIYTMGNNYENGDQNSSFATNMLINNASNGKETDKTEYATMSYEEACLDYFFVNGVATLHFPESLAQKVHAEISSYYAWPTAEEDGRMPDRNQWISTGYREIDDFTRRCTVDGKADVGSNGQGIWTTDGWAQFLLMRGYEPEEETVVYTKEYDDVWHTMCFPFDLTDEQLATAFNEGFNIVDFSGVEIKEPEETEEGKKTLILHFNKVAQTFYRDEEGVIYEKIGKDDDGFNIFQGPDGTYRHYLIAKAPGAKSFVKEGTQSPIVYIEGYLATAGHPYMVHPNTGANSGSPLVRCHFSGIKWIESTDPNKTTEQVRRELFENRARTVDLGQAKTDDNYNQVAYPAYAGQTYTFKGNALQFREGATIAPEPQVPEEPKMRLRPDRPSVTLEDFERDNKPVKVDDPGITWGATEMNLYKLMTEGKNQYELGPWKDETVITANYNDNSSQWNAWNNKKHFFDGITGVPNPHNETEACFNKCKTVFNNSGAAIAYSQYQKDLESYTKAYNELANAWDAYNSYTETAAQQEYNEAYQTYLDQIAAHENWEKDVMKYQILIPTGAYFLGRQGRGWPKFYLEIADDTRDNPTGGFWTQYTAVVIPDGNAKDGIEAELDGASQSSAGVNMVFDEDFDGMYDPTEVKEIVAEAEKQGQKVEYMDIVISINGQVVRRGSTSLEGLPTGLYIVNGKKYYVK